MLAPRQGIRDLVRIGPEQVVERMGGSIAAGSDPGRGSAFRFTLPLDRSSTLRRADVSRARRELGWEPRRTLEEGLGRTWEWLSGS